MHRYRRASQSAAVSVRVRFASQRPQLSPSQSQECTQSFEEVKGFWAVSRVKNTIAVIATPADEESFQDDRVGYHMPLKAFNMYVNNTMMRFDALCAQCQQYCMRHNGSCRAGRLFGVLWQRMDRRLGVALLLVAILAGAPPSCSLEVCATGCLLVRDGQISAWASTCESIVSASYSTGYQLNGACSESSLRQGCYCCCWGGMLDSPH